jgi:uncharacterized protein YukE
MTYISDKKLDEITLASSAVGTVLSGAGESDYSRTCAHLEQKLAKYQKANKDLEYDVKSIRQKVNQAEDLIAININDEIADKTMLIAQRN